MKRLIYIMLPFVFLSCEESLTEKNLKMYPNGNIQVQQLINKKGEVKKEIQFFENGKRRIEGCFDELGRRDGVWNSYYEDGKLWSTSEYEHGLQQGMNKVNYSNGKVRFEGFWKNDKQIGTWKFYSEKGELLKSEDYSKK